MEDDSVRFWQEWQNQFEQKLLELLEAEIKAEKEKASAKPSHNLCKLKINLKRNWK